jgi:hypothetical protein
MDFTVNVSERLFPAATFNVRDFGGNDDKNTIQRALDACGTAGGGKVIVPAGVWQCKALRMSGNTELHFEEGAVGALHSHPHTQTTYVLEGEFEFTTPASEICPRHLNALSRVTVALVGSVVLVGALKNAPPTFGLPTLTLVAELGIFLSS